MKTFPKIKELQYCSTGVFSDNEEVINCTEKRSRDNIPNPHSFSSGTSNSNNVIANQCVKTFALVEDRQWPSPMTLSSASTSNAVMCNNLIKETISGTADASASTRNNDERQLSRENDTVSASPAHLPNLQQAIVASAVTDNEMSGDAIEEASSEINEIIISIQAVNMDAIEIDPLSTPAATVNIEPHQNNTSTAVLNGFEKYQDPNLKRICNNLSTTNFKIKTFS